MYPIEHALVMDTDHLPGGGGYAVVGVSPGVTDAERVFVSENFGISNYLHDPGNARLYFSVFPVPEGRMALVRRFANGTRRGGGQNRLFVHTLFLDENVLHALHYLPWLLLDQPLQSGDKEVYLTVDPGPLLEGGFSPLHWAGGIADRDAFEQLQLRYQQFRKRLEQQDDYGDVDGFDAIAAVQESLRREGRAILPQGTSFEQLSLLAWSMLPPPDRLQLPWTQHDSRNTTTGFAVANAPDGAFVNLRTPSSEPVRRTIRLNTYSVESWSDLCETTLRNGISLRSGTLDWWLKWRDSLEDLLDNPLATDRELLPRLERVASAVRLERRDPWVDELEVLRFLLAIVNRAIDQGQPPEIAVRRWNGLFQRTGIAAVVFRQLPPDEWLDESEKRIGAALVAECFMAGSEGLSAAAGTREAVAHWLLKGRRLEGVPVNTIGRLLERLAVDESPLVYELIPPLLAHPKALRELAGVLPIRKRELGRILLALVTSAIDRGEKDAGWAAGAMLVPQLEANPDLGKTIERGDAEVVSDALRDKPELYVRFAARLETDVVDVLVRRVESWLARDRRAAIPVARQILEQINRRAFPNVSAERLAFAAAEAGEPARLWMPAAIDIAARLDAAEDPFDIQQFAKRVQSLPHPKGEDQDAVRQIAAALRQFAGEQRVGACLRALVQFAQPSWSLAGTSLAEALQAAVAGGRARPAEWSSVIADLVKLCGRNGQKAVAAKLVTTFWERLTPDEVGTASPALIEALTLLDGEAPSRVVKRWLLSVRSLPKLATAEHFLGALGEIATDEQYALLEVERAWREIALDAADSRTLCRLDSALRISKTKTDHNDIASAISRLTEQLPAASQAAWLVKLAAAGDTPPSTRNLIETRFLRKAFVRFIGTDWQHFLDKAGDDLFVYGNILLMVARHLALADPSPNLRSRFEQACIAHDREDALEGVAGAVPQSLKERVVDWYRGAFGS